MTSYLSITEARRLLVTKKISPLELLTELEQRISTINPKIKAYLSWDHQQARLDAEKADLTKPLGGIPIGIKDAILVQGAPAYSSSRILEGYHAPYDATVIKNLRAAGAYPLGRLNMDEFAMGSSTETSAFHPTYNPWDVSRIPGGSSGGSAAAVAAGIAMATLGSDTGGSIRQPAAFCGCVGMKPTYGRVSRYGLIAFASSLDQIGPLTHTVEDSALLLNAISGVDSHDSTSLLLPKEDFTSEIGQDLKGVRIGIPKEYFVEGIEPGVRTRVEEAIKQMISLGAEPIEISLPHTEYAVSVYYIIVTAEASSNLARYDGVRYGKRSAQTKDLLSLYEQTREEGFGAEVKRRIILGTYVLTSGYYDAYYLRAQKVRRLIRQDFEEAFKKVDLIVSATSPETAFRCGEKINDPLKMYLADIFTIAANLAGICGMSLPCGFASKEGKDLPVGLQLIGPSFGEKMLFRVGHAYQQATEWHTQHPSML
ncbi:MAG: Asp-tRNA(Asn)/Glu-tRNA(Gln) amidotransferase subunit GatA [Verrucomicrobia bacterium]|nr:MAG: Asp-tRNA(Asn)/Glu-tRNA(Gln) amidotransferase subunit GatA [Verrucomicrobiota bacterium]